MADKYALTKWINKTTPDERKRVAKEASTTASYLYQLSNEKSRRRINVVTAAQIEIATRKLHKSTKGRTPVVTVFDLAAMCE